MVVEDENGNNLTGDTLSIKTSRTTVYNAPGEQLVVLVGPENLYIVNLPGLLLVVNKNWVGPDKIVE